MPEMAESGIEPESVTTGEFGYGLSTAFRVRSQCWQVLDAMRLMSAILVASHTESNDLTRGREIWKYALEKQALVMQKKPQMS